MRLGIRQLCLTHFRSYETLRLSLGEALAPVVLTGANGAGKTNILEAISFLTPGRGLRGARLSDIATRKPDDALFASNGTLGAFGISAGAGLVGQSEQGAVADVAATDMAATGWAVSARVQTLDGMVQVGTGKDGSSERRQIKIDGENAKTQSELGNVLSAIWVTPAQDRLFWIGLYRLLTRGMRVFVRIIRTRSSNGITCCTRADAMMRGCRLWKNKSPPMVWQ